MDNFNDWDLQAVVRSCSFAHAEDPDGARHQDAAAARGAQEAAAPAPAPPNQAPVREERRATTPARAAPAASGRGRASTVVANKEQQPSRLYGIGYLDLDHKRPFLLPPSATTTPRDEVMISFPAASVASTAGAVPTGRKGGARTPRPKRSKKSQLKKVVREVPVADGGVSSSDPWAWRKYGQKPIKGSPYPRGYYKCSSMKGCMARKLVERSPAKPGVLKVTYLADHCHPVPTQLNALAGTTRHTKSASATADAGATPAAGEDQSAAAAASSPKIQEQQSGTAADSTAAPVAVERGCAGAEETTALGGADDEASEFWPAAMDLDELLAPVDDDFDFDAVLDDDDVCWDGGTRSS